MNDNLLAIDDLGAVRLLSVARVGLGAALVVAPGLAARAWIGAEAEQPGTKALARALGARDVGLGLGGLFALRRGRPVRGWLEAAALAESVDVLATLLAWRALPWSGRVLGVTASGAAAYLDARLARAGVGADSSDARGG